MQFVKLLSVLLCVLSLLNIAASQDCPSSGIACYPADCCGQFRQCIGSTFFPVQNTAPGTLCKAGTTVWPSDCANTPCPSSPSGGQQPAATPAPTKAAPPVAATTRPITAAPTTRAPTAAPATPVPTQAVTAPPATAAPATPAPTARPTQAPATPAPTARPTQAATAAPTTRPTQAPATPAPTAAPTAKPTVPIVITPTQAPSNSGCKLSDIFTYADYQTLFPYANGGAINGVTNQHAIFNYSYLISAAANFPNFACSGSVAQRKQEVAAFLAHTSQESSGWWAGQPYNWGYYFSTEVGCTDASCQMYCDPSNTQYPCAPGKGYFGRGPIQLSWNYNYGQVSELLYGDKNVLLNNPDKLFDTAGTAFMTALWFWMTPQYPKPSCHDVMTGGFTPSASDAAIGRLPGFGLTINIVNGGIECGHTSPQQVINRIGYYTTYINYFFGAGNSAMVGANVDCASMRAY